jgi:AcrR family transcriptional regulator
LTGRTKSRPRREGHRARKGEGGLLRGQILDVTEELLHRHGSIDAVSIRAIAEAAGVTPPAIYLHFEDKDQLFYAVCRRGFDRFAARLAPILSSEGSAFDRIQRLGVEYVKFGLENSQQYIILFGIKRDVTIPPEELEDDPGLRILSGLVTLVEEAQSSGDIRSDHPAATVAALLWAVSHGTTSLLINARAKPEVAPLPPKEEMIPAMIDLVIGGVGT